MSKRETLVIAVLLVDFLLAGCGSTSSDVGSQTVAVPEPEVEPTPGLIDLVVLHTNDNWGETEPCGWGKNSTVRRRATYITGQRELAEHLLLLDTGDALTVEGNPESQTMGEDIVAGMNLMGYDAMAIGPVDLKLGAAALRQRMSEAEFPLLSANVLWRGDRGYVGDSYTILQAGSYRIGVIGLTRLPDGELFDYEFLDPEGVLAKLVPELGEQVDVVVLLTNLRYRSALELAEAVPGIDLVVAALPRQLPDHAVRAPHTGTLVVTAEQPLPRHTGRRVGKLTVKVDSAGTLRSVVWASTPMGPEVADDPHMKELLDEYR